jgi:hypothetical protein
MPSNMFGELLDMSKDPQYAGMYPGADPNDKAQMVREGIPSAQQEALQTPRIDPVMATAMALAGPSVRLYPEGMSTKGGGRLGYSDIRSLFAYLLHQAIGSVKEGTENSAISTFRDFASRNDQVPWAKKQP